MGRSMHLEGNMTMDSETKIIIVGLLIVAFIIGGLITGGIMMDCARARKEAGFCSYVREQAHADLSSCASTRCHGPMEDLPQALFGEDD